jgi:hypothetical protein
MSTPPRRQQLTLVGMQPPSIYHSRPGSDVFVPDDHRDDARTYLEQTFPLTPYADATVYTPTHERPIERRTILPPARKSLPTMVLRRPIAREPSRVALVMAAVICCYVVALLMLLTF